VLRIPATRFLGYAQTHDQVGNRAVGERLVHLTDPARAKIAAALVLCSPFVPMLFQGEEWGASTAFQYFTDHPDAELGAAVSEGRRREFASFGWAPEDVPDPQDAATFERSRLVWDELGTDPHRDLLDWHRRLLALRRATPALTDPRLETVSVRYDEAECWLVVDRGDVAVAINASGHTSTLPVAGRLLLASADGVEVTTDQATLPAWSVAVLALGAG
jgi:maltooligosyltrehalose trehalohydrolase